MEEQMTDRCARIPALVGALVLLLAGAGTAAPKGSIFITDHPIDTTSATFEKDLKKAAVTTLNLKPDGWTLHFVAYLKRAAGSPELNIVFYEAGGAHEQVNAFPIATSAKAEVLSSNIAVTTEQGFKVGNKYDVRITRLIGGKEEVYARTTLTLAK